MTTAYATTQLAAAQQELSAARAKMNAAKAKGRSWFLAEEDVNFWSGKVANMEAALKGGGLGEDASVVRQLLTAS